MELMDTLKEIEARKMMILMSRYLGVRLDRFVGHCLTNCNHGIIHLDSQWLEN